MSTPAGERPARQTSRGRRPGSSWLRLVLFNVILVGIPFGLYFVFYVDARNEQTIVRYFRALDASARRLVTIIENVPRIAENVPSPPLSRANLLSHSTEPGTRGAVTAAVYHEALENPPPGTADDAAADATGDGLVRPLEQPADHVLRLYELQRQLSVRCRAVGTSQAPSASEAPLPDGGSAVAVRASLTAIEHFYAEYIADFESAASATTFEVVPLLRTEDLPPATLKNCEDAMLGALYGYIRELAPAACNGSGQQRRLRRTRNGVVIEVEDCRSFSRRSVQLSRALESAELRELLDRFGVRVVLGLDTLARSISANVAPLFDQYLIADAHGNMLYLAGAGSNDLRYDSVTGAPLGRRARLDFLSQTNVKALVLAREDEADGAAGRPLSLGPNGTLLASPAGGRSSYGIHSRLERFSIGDMGFTAFVHPFVVSQLEMVGAAADDTQAGISDATVLYMIGIVSSESLSRQSLSLRLAYVGDAINLIGALLAATVFLWLWTSGERLTLRAGHFLLLLSGGTLSAFLMSLLVAHHTTRLMDTAVLDRALEEVHGRMVRDVAGELRQRVEELAGASRTMLLRHGEAPARQAHKVAVEGEQFDLATRKRFACAPWTDSGEAPYPAAAGRFPSYDLAFLLDHSGRQWQCLSNRRFLTAPLPLGFRPYFQRPRDGRLWQVTLESPQRDTDAPQSRIPIRTNRGREAAPTGDATASSAAVSHDSGASPPFFIERVTSVLDGTTETVLSARPGDLCTTAKCAAAAQDTPAAVILGRLHSLEESVLPPHMRFAVIDNRTGNTLFHSVREQAMASNFIKQTGGDASLFALVDAGSKGLVDLSYSGISIRAYAAPLADGIPWTLITYRSHEVEDVLGAMTLTATAASVAAGWLLLLVVSSLVWWHGMRHGRHWRDRLPALDVRICAGLLILAAVLVGVLVVRPAQGNLVAVLSLLAAFAVAVSGYRHSRWHFASAALAARRRRELSWTVITIVVLVAVLPALAWFAFYRADVSAGLAEYLRVSAAHAVQDKCRRHRGYLRRYREPIREITANTNGQAPQLSGIFTHGWTLADPDGAGAPTASGDCALFAGAGQHLAVLRDTLGPADGPGHGGSAALGMTASLSPLAGDLVVHAGRSTAPANLTSPRAVIAALLNEPHLDAWQRLPARFAMVAALLVLAGALLVRLTAVSLVDRVLGVHPRIALLKSTALRELPGSWTDDSRGPLRVCVVHRGEHLCRALVDTLLAQRFDSAQTLRWNGSEFLWEPIAPSPSATVDKAGGVLYVVEGLERMLLDETTRRELLRKLEVFANGTLSLLICSRIVPGYWLAKLTNEAVEHLPDVPANVAESARWSHLIGPLDVRRLVDRRVNIEQRFSRQLDVLGADADIPAAIRAELLEEGVANPDLVDLAASVARDSARRGDPPEPAGVTLRHFTAGAAGYFHQQWTLSSYEERLQMYALAVRGFANPAQPDVLSSLANRGLITEQGPVHLRSRAFAEFIRNDLDHHSLLAWRAEGRGNLWRSIWPPLAVLVVLALAFFVSSTPEALGPLAVVVAAAAGAVPVLTSVIRSFRDLRHTPTE